MSMCPPLPPPIGFATWLDFAVETLDTRGVWVGAPVAEDGTALDSDAIRKAARADLAKLRRQANDARTAFDHGNFAPKGIYRFKSHDEQNRQEDRRLADGMAKLAFESTRDKSNS